MHPFSHTSPSKMQSLKKFQNRNIFLDCQKSLLLFCQKAYLIGDVFAVVVVVVTAIIVVGVWLRRRPGVHVKKSNRPSQTV